MGAALTISVEGWDRRGAFCPLLRQISLQPDRLLECRAMTYQVLARKWRPKNFASLVGQEHVVQALSNALEKQRLHHAYLFTGTRGVGKTTLARIVAKALNCETGITATPCGECSACRQIDAGRFVDLLELDAASNTGIDNMREVIDNAQYAPTAGRFKVYIIDEVHMLSKSAFNAMLKTLEEPPAHVKFILATKKKKKVPVTVLSRCLQFNLRQIPPAVVAGHLQYVLDQESLPYESAALSLLGHAAAGSMRDSLSLLDQAIAYGSGKVDEAGVRAMLGAIDQTFLLRILEALANSDGNALLAEVDRMAERSIGFEAALQDLASLLHRIALAQITPAAITAMVDAPALTELAARFSAEEVQLYYQIALHGRRDLALAPDEYAGFSMALLRMLAFAPVADAGAARIAATTAMPARTQPALTQAKPRAAAPVAGMTPMSPVEAEKPGPSVAPAEVAAAEVVPAAPARPLAQAGIFDGDWPGLVSRLTIGGMAKMLAQNCALQSYSSRELQLILPSASKHLADKGYQDKLRTALETVLGSDVVMKLTVGDTAAATPAVLQQQAREERQAEAETAIRSDDFVKNVVEQFDGRIVDGSIKPL